MMIYLAVVASLIPLNFPSQKPEKQDDLTISVRGASREARENKARYIHTDPTRFSMDFTYTVETRKDPRRSWIGKRKGGRRDGN